MILLSRHGLRRVVLLFILSAQGMALLWLLRFHNSPLAPPAPIVLAPAHVVVTVAPPKYTLLNRARRVTGFKKNEMLYTHQWLSSHEMLMVDDVYDSPQVFVYILDTRTKKCRSLMHVNRALQAKVDEGILQKGTNAWSYRSCEVSPDGRWLMEHDRGGTNIMRLDGSQLRHIEDRGRWDSVQWLQDSRHCLTHYSGFNGHFLDYAELSLYSLKTGAKVRDLPDSRHNEIDVRPHVAEEDQETDSTSDEFSAYATKNVFLANFPSEKQQRQGQRRAGIYRRLLTSTRKPIKIGAIRLPQIGKVVDAAFSRHLDRIAWAAVTTHRLTVWTAHINGANMHKIGSIEGNFDTNSDLREQFSALKWLPDGKHLSFLYKEGVYVVPSE